MKPAPAGLCLWCGGAAHGGFYCPAVKALDFDPFGNVTRVEFLTPIDVSPPHRDETSTQDQAPDYYEKRPPMRGS